MTSHPEHSNAFGNTLKAFRKTAKLSQAKAAEVIGISPRQLWNIEMGKASLPSEREVITKEKALAALKAKAGVIPVEVVK